MSSLGQVQLVKWSLPAFALILGLLWYKRRRVDRVDPGGASSKIRQGGDTALANGSAIPKGVNKTPAKNLCDSGIHTDDSFILNQSTSTPVDGVISPRKVSESLDIPNRKPSSQSTSMLSCKSIELSNTPWYDDVEEDTPEMREIQLGSNPTKSGFDYMSKSKSTEIKNNSRNSSVMENIEEEVKVTKVVVAKRDTSNSPKADFKSCEKSVVIENQRAGSSCSNSDDKKQMQALSERDSANHSPVSGVLDGSVNDEARSEGSTDSGKGGSINGHPKDATRTVYEFLLPEKLVGKMIGKRGKFVQSLRSNASVSVLVKRHPTDRNQHICCVEGLQENITVALEMIREHFPEKMHPNFTLEPFAYEDIIAEEIPWVPELLQLALVEGVNNDVIVSHIVSPCHFFVQLSTHPTYPSLRVLDEKMTQLYSTGESPPVPDELNKGMILVAKWYDKWVRVNVESPDPAGEQTLVRLVDHGGYYTFSNADMRKIRSDYLTLPFQAIEVFLANVKPKEEQWSEEAYNVVAQICSGMIGQAQIVGYVDCSTFINLYFNIHKHGVISIADELIARVLADPLTLDEVVTQEVLPAV